MSRVLLKVEHMKFMDYLCKDELSIEDVVKRMKITERHSRYIKQQVTLTYDVETFTQAVVKHTKEILR